MSRIDFYTEVPKAIGLIKKESYNSILKATMEWHSGIVEDMLTGKREGRLYRIPGARRRKYRASLPYEPPASRTGRLRASYRFRVVWNNSNDLVGEVGSPLNYALSLEKGTSRMAPRPHVEPGYYSREENINRILGRTWF